VPTIFDAAQTNIFKLMESDSFPRYVRTPEYKQFCSEAQGVIKQKSVYRDAGLL
jgi:hypothetical protein